MKGGDDEDRIDGYARLLDQLWRETSRQRGLTFLAYLVGMAALVAADESKRRSVGAPSR